MALALLRLPSIFQKAVTVTGSVTVKREYEAKGQETAAPNSFWERAAGNPWLSIAVIVAFCAVIYGRSLGSFFLADDIGEVRYIHQIFNGRWDLFWSNFTGNFMQVPNMSVYRPMLLLTLMFDYAIWKGNPLGYYLSNLLYYTGASAMLCVFLRMLCRSWGKLRAGAIGLAAGLLFAANPLHCESISWVVGRVDTACCLFYLAAICCVMKGSAYFRAQPETKPPASQKWGWLGILFFAMAICVKEMAIGFAPVLSALAFFFVPVNSELNRAASETAALSSSTLKWIKQRASAVWSFSGGAWIATGVYFVVRYLALGTLLGGYNGSVGAAQSASAIAKWLDVDNWHRLLFPFSVDIFTAGSLLERGLAAAYMLAIGLVFMRVLAGSIPWRWTAFLLFWAATQAAPIYRLWGLGFNLEGARFCFFLTMTLSSFLPVLLFAPENNLPAKFSRRLLICSAVSISAIFLIMSKTAYATNLLWLHAGKEVRSVLNEATALAANCSANEKLMLLGVPKRHAGAHMILNGPTLQMLLSPPFVKKECSQPFLTFDSVLFGEENIINGQRFRALVNKPAYRGPFVWSGARKTFVPVSLTDSAVEQEFLLHPTAGDGIKISGLNVSPLDYSYLRISFRSSNNSIPLPFRVQWKAKQGLSALKDACTTDFTTPPDSASAPDSVRTVYIPLGSNWTWYAQSEISEIRVSVPGVEHFALEGLSLVPAKLACPEFGRMSQCNNSGALCYEAGSKLPISSQRGTALQVQLSKNQYFFDVQNEELNRDVLKKEFKLSGTQADIVLNKDDFGASGYYQLRARALDANGTAIGSFSDPLTIWVQN